MDDGKVAAAVGRWSRSGRELILLDTDYTIKEQVAILVRCEVLLKKHVPNYGVIKWDRVYKTHFIITSTLLLKE